MAAATVVQPRTWLSARGIAADLIVAPRTKADHESRTIVLLHGIGGSRRSCVPLAELLAQRCLSSVCWDAPGYGDSSDPGGDVDYAAEVLGVLDELGLESVDLFGTSWGGVIAAEVALRAPGRVRTLCLADSTRGSAIDPVRARAMRDRVGSLRAEGADAFAGARAPKLVAPDCDEQTFERVRSEMAKVRAPGYASAAEYMASADLGPRLHEITVPTLVLVGEFDVVTGVEESRLLASAIPGARFGMIVGAGHAAVSERPHAVSAQLIEFLRAESS